MKWCCMAFEGHYMQAGSRGFTILIGRNSAGKPQFVLQHRALDKGAEGSVKSDEAPISVVSDVVIQYCPWCGRRLEKWYGKSVDDLFRPDLRISIPSLDG